MGKTNKPDWVNYVAHVFTSGNSNLWLDDLGLKEKLIKNFGEIDYISDPIDFQKFTDFYNDEMGKNIRVEGRMISFKNLGSQAFLAEAKNITNELEKEYTVDGKRKVNIDIGFVHHTQFVLASTKHWGNRIYIGKGIFAEITLIYVYGKWSSLEYSYVNFKNETYQQELEKIRNIYMPKRKEKMIKERKK
jgi:hypothetical protein